MTRLTGGKEGPLPTLGSTRGAEHRRGGVEEQGGVPRRRHLALAAWERVGGRPPLASGPADALSLSPARGRAARARGRSTTAGRDPTRARRAARAGSCGAWLSPLPSSKRRRRTGVGVRARPWGSADGLTEKGTHGVQPGRPASRRRGGRGTEAAVAWGCGAPSRGALDVQNESPPRVGRPGTPRGLTARGLQQRGGPTAPRGAFAGLSTTTANIQSRSRRGRMLSVRVPAPLGPSSTTRRAQRSPGVPQATEAWGRHPGEAWPVRSQTGEGGTGGVPCRQGKGQQRQGGAASTHSQGRGSGAQALSREQKDRDTAGPTGKLARGPTATHTRVLP